MHEKDKKIKELTIRLEATRKLNKKEDNPFLEMSVIIPTPDDNRDSMFPTYLSGPSPA